MQELLALYRFTLRSGDRRLADALARAMRSDPGLRARADLELRELPRDSLRGSQGAERKAAVERAVAGALRRIGPARP
jgi:hypothetical protein